MYTSVRSSTVYNSRKVQIALRGGARRRRWHTLTAAYDSAAKRRSTDPGHNGEDPENIRLDERSQTQNATYRISSNKQPE